MSNESPAPNLSAEAVAEELGRNTPDSGQLSRLYDALAAMLDRSRARLRDTWNTSAKRQVEHNCDDGLCQDGV